MGDKPYLQIEVDEHFSPVGVITRIEAFLQSLEGRPAQPLPAGFFPHLRGTPPYCGGRRAGENRRAAARA